MGLERVAAVVQGKPQQLRHRPLPAAHRRRSATRAGKTYGERRRRDDVSLRVIADHCARPTFLIADGVLPGNEGRGYVLRKIMRRAMRHGKKLGHRGPFLHELHRGGGRAHGRRLPGARRPGGVGPRTSCGRRRSASARRSSRRSRSSSRSRRRPRAAGVIPGADAFKLYDTYGLPLDFTRGAREGPRPARRPRRASSASSRRSRSARASRARWARSPATPSTWACSSSTARPRSSATRASALEDARVLAVVKDGALVEAARRGERGRHHPRPHAVLRRVGRPGRRPRRHQRGRLDGRGRWTRPCPCRASTCTTCA